jgi:hypothetical protein
MKIIKEYTRFFIRKQFLAENEVFNGNGDFINCSLDAAFEATDPTCELSPKKLEYMPTIIECNLLSNLSQKFFLTSHNSLENSMQQLFETLFK